MATKQECAVENIPLTFGSFREHRGWSLRRVALTECTLRNVSLRWRSFEAACSDWCLPDGLWPRAGQSPMSWGRGRGRAGTGSLPAPVSGSRRPVEEGQGVSADLVLKLNDVAGPQPSRTSCRQLSPRRGPRRPHGTVYSGDTLEDDCSSARWAQGSCVPAL